jgi:hypothetical protein
MKAFRAPRTPPANAPLAEAASHVPIPMMVLVAVIDPHHLQSNS